MGGMLLGFFKSSDELLIFCLKPLLPILQYYTLLPTLKFWPCLVTGG